jgi:hypothetical protein
MSTLAILFLALLALSFIPMGWVVLRAYRRFRGKRVVTCPETGCAAAVEVDRAHAAVTTAMGEPELRLTSCTQWPEKKGCGQDCVSQIEASPDGCLVRSMLVDWYRGADCVICRKQIPEIHSSDNKPALETPEGRTIEWDEVKAEDLPQVLKTHRPVCWDCHARSFRAQFPALAVGGDAGKRAS